MVFFEAPHRTEAALAAMAEALGDDRAAAVCRELTKLHEEVWRGTLDEAVAHWAGLDRIRGEVTVVLGAVTPPPADFEAAVAAAQQLIAAGIPASEAVRRVAAERGVPRRALYERVIGSSLT